MCDKTYNVLKWMAQLLLPAMGTLYFAPITGVGETIKAWTNDVRIVAVEPFENQALGGGFTGGHGIPDIGYGISGSI